MPFHANSARQLGRVEPWPCGDPRRIPEKQYNRSQNTASGMRVSSFGGANAARPINKADKLPRC